MEKLIKTEQLVYVDGIGDVLMGRVLEAGITEIGIGNLDKVAAVNGLGTKRMWALKKYLVWYQSYGGYVVERNDNYEIYEKEGEVIIRFALEVGPITFTMVRGKAFGSDGVEGDLSLVYQDNSYKLGFRVTPRSFWIENTYSMIPGAMKVLKRAREVIIARSVTNVAV